MRKMRLLQILPNFGPGGAERMVTHLLLRLDRNRFQVAAVSLFDRQGTDLEAMLERAGVPVWYLGKHRGFDPRMFGRLEGVFREFRPDIVHTHRYVLRYLLPSVLSQRARAWIHTVHTLAEKEVDFVGKWVHRLAFRLGVVPVAIAQEVAQSLERVYGMKNVPLIPNGIPVSEYALGEKARRAWRKQEGFEETEVLIVSVARLSPQKDPFTLLQAFSFVVWQHPKLCLLVVGDGPLRSELEEMAKRLGLADRVRFLGVRTDVPEVLAGADVFVLSSRYEGNPLSVMEAMAAGKPVVATAVGGVPELVEDGVSGILVPPGDVEALARAIARLVEDVGLRLRLGQEASNRAREQFDVGFMVRQYETLYERLLAKG
ncbi:glycosyltransferase [Thermus albus]|uniref:glycosyltransferase n=1 Tax=Thermus albus TaxID=2908146 RepID=UPI001FA96D02|nr:glycosyltransferase [Thermus albus]